MFTQQANQIESALRLGGAGQQSAKEMVQAIANCAQPLEHRGTMALSMNSPVHSNTFQPPRGVALHQSHSRSRAQLNPPERDAPLWGASPASPAPTDAKQITLTVRGPSKIDDLQAGNIDVVDAKVRGLMVARDIGADGVGRFGGGLRVNGPADLGGPVNIDGRVTNHNTVVNRSEIFNESNVYNQSETHNYGPTYSYGNTYVNGREVKPFPVTVVVDVIYDGTKFQKITRQIMAVSAAGPTSTATVLDCSA